MYSISMISTKSERGTNFSSTWWFINASPNKVVTEVSKVNAISPFSSVLKKSVHLITTRIEIVVLLDYISVDIRVYFKLYGIWCFYLWAQYILMYWRWLFFSVCTGIWSGEVQHCPQICQRLIQRNIRNHHRVGDHYK